MTPTPHARTDCRSLERQAGLTAAARGLPTLTIIMPAYNEEQSIEAAVREVQNYIFPVVPTAELIVVDDGSRDRTPAILDFLSTEDPRVKVIHQPNGGHGSALRTGLEAATGRYVLLIDSDRQIPLTAFAAAWSQIASGSAAAVFGVRRRRLDPLPRLILTAIVRHCIRLVFGVRLFDANVPFKVFPRSAWVEARPLLPANTLAPSLFLAVFMKRRGYRVAEVDVPHRARETGQAINASRLARFCARAFLQLIAFRSALR